MSKKEITYADMLALMRVAKKLPPPSPEQLAQMEADVMGALTVMGFPFDGDDAADDEWLATLLEKKGFKLDEDEGAE